MKWNKKNEEPKPEAWNILHMLCEKMFLLGNVFRAKYWKIWRKYSLFLYSEMGSVFFFFSSCNNVTLLFLSVTSPSPASFLQCLPSSFTSFLSLFPALFSPTFPVRHSIPTESNWAKRIIAHIGYVLTTPRKPWCQIRWQAIVFC